VREGAKDVRGAIAAFALFLKAEPDAPEAAAIRDRIYALEIPAEEQDRKAVLVGTWQSESGGILKFEFQEDRFIITFPKTSESAKKAGYYDGQVIFNGTWDGGTKVIGEISLPHDSGGQDYQFVNCFGKFGKYPATLYQTPNETLTLQYIGKWISRYNPTTCEVLQRTDLNISSKYHRLKE
jgi:hypothetical protein